MELEDEVATDLARATGFGTADGGVKKLNRMLPLTGFSDPLYAEAYVTVHQYDIVMDVTVVNRTGETLQNVCLELATMGDLKLVVCPPPPSHPFVSPLLPSHTPRTGALFDSPEPP